MKQPHKTSLLTIQKRPAHVSSHVSVLRWHNQQHERFYHEQLQTLHHEPVMVQWEKGFDNIRVLYDNESKKTFMSLTKLELLKETQVFARYFNQASFDIRFDAITDDIMKKIRETEDMIEYRVNLLGQILFDSRYLLYIAKIHTMLNR